jgi:autotransporter translocation and assembly factor TamB
VILLLLVVLFLQTGAGQDVVRNQAIARANDALAGEVEVGELSGGLLSKARLEDVRVVDARGNTVAYAPRVSADYSLLGLLGNSLTVSEVTLESPVVVARTYADGESNFSLIAKPTPTEPTGPGTFELLVEQATIRDGTVLVVDETRDDVDANSGRLAEWLARLHEDEVDTEALSASLPDAVPNRQTDVPETLGLTALTLDAAFAMRGSMDYTATVRSLKASAATDSAFGRRDLVLESLEASYQPSHVEATLGRLTVSELAEVAELRAAADLTVDEDALGNRTPSGLERYFADVERVAAWPKVTEVFAPSVGLADVTHASLTSAGDVDSHTFDVTLNCPADNALRAAGRVDAPDGDWTAMEYDVALMADDFSGAACAEIARPVQKLTTTIRANGRGTAPETLQSDIAMSMRDSQFLDYRVDDASLSASASDGRGTIGRLMVQTPYADATATGTADTNGEFDIEVDIDGAEELADRARQITGRNIQSKTIDVAVDADGELDLEADDAPGMLQRLSLAADWSLDGFQMEDSVAISSSDGDVSVQVETPGGAPDKRRVAFDVRVTGQSVDTPFVSAGYLLLDAEGRGTVALPLDNPIEALEDLSSKWVFRTRGFRAPGARISRADITANLGRTRPGGSLAWDLDGTVSGVRAGGQSIGFADADLRGTADLRSTDAGTELSTISAKGQLSATDLDAGGVTAEALDADIDVSGRVPMLEGTVKVDGRNIQAGEESIDSTSATLELTGDRRFDLRGTVDRSGETSSLRLDASGQLNRDLDGAEFDTFRAGTDEMTWTLEKGASVSASGGTLSVDDLELSTGNQRIRVDGAYRASGRQDLDASFENISIAEIREKLDIQQIPDVRGVVTGDVRLRGTAREPEIDVDILLEEFFYDDYGPFKLVAKARYADDVAKAEQLVLSGYEIDFFRASGRFPIDLDLQGNYDILRSEPMNVSVEIPEFALPDIYEVAPQLDALKAVGRVEGRLRLDGSLASPRIKTRVQASGIGITGDVGGQRVQLEKVDFSTSLDFKDPRGKTGGIDISVDADWRDKKVIEGHLRTPMPLADWAAEVLDSPDSDIDWIGRVESLPFDVALSVDNLNLSKVPVESLAKADAEGTVVFDLQGSGTFASPDVKLDAGIQDFGWDRFRDMYLDVNVEQRAGTLYVERIRFEWDADEIFVAEGKFPTPVAQILGREEWKDIPIDFKLELRELPIKKLSAVDYQFAGIRGSFAGFVTADGSLRKPNLQGRLGLFNTELARGRTGTVALQFGANAGSVRARASICEDDNEVLFANARVPATLDVIALAQGASFLRDETMRASIKSEQLRLGEVLPTRMFDEYFSDLSGDFRIDMSVFGKLGELEDMSLRGTVDLEDGDITLPMFGRRFRDITVDLDVDEQGAKLSKLSFEESDSEVALEGTLGLDGIRPTAIDMNFSSDEFNVGGFGTTFAAFVTSDIKVDGTLEKGRRNITATAEELEVVLPESQAGELHPTELNQDIIVIRRNTARDAMISLETLTEQRGEQEESEPLELRFVAERGSWLRHPNGNVEFTSDVSVRVADAGVQMGGSVDTVRGSIEFLGKRFDIPEKEGVVRFTGAAEPNPVLDAEAIHRLDERIAEALQEPTSGEARVIVRVRGRADDPKLLLSSDPGMTESDIIQVLVTGRPPQDSGVGQDQGLQGQALSAATGLLSGLVQQKLAGAVPVDVLRLEAGDKGLGSGRISVGKYITERLFVSYSYKFGNEEEEAENVAKIEYRFAPRWKLETQYSDQQTGEFNIFWELPLRWLND